MGDGRWEIGRLGDWEMGLIERSPRFKVVQGQLVA